MPISLITGVPGSGKTAWLVYQLMTRADLKDRPLYVFNIPDLKVPHEAITEEQARTWPEWAPTGALFVMDECQRVFRPRRSGSDVPAYVSEFETHRHRGLDFFLLTQNPRLIDANVRDLVGEHRHIGKTLIGLRRMLYWNSGGAKNPAARRDIAEASTSVFFLPKKAFGMYKSAEEHTVVSGKLAKGVYVLPIALAATVYGVYVLKGRYDAHTAPKVQAAQAAKPQASGERAALAISEPDAGGYYPSASAPAPAVERPVITAEMYTPAIPGKPWTAPVYSPHNTQITTMPYPVACVQSDTGCTCYTDQATPIRDMDDGICRDFVANGIYNPYLQDENPAPAAPAAAPPG